MGEKIAFFSWDLITVKCGEHLIELELTERSGRAFYSCCENGCRTHIPSEIYEKILAETVERMNSETLIIGGKWQKRYAGKSYVCRVLSFPGGKQVEIAVTPLCV